MERHGPLPGLLVHAGVDGLRDRGRLRPEKLRPSLLKVRVAHSACFVQFLKTAQFILVVHLVALLWSTAQVPGLSFAFDPVLPFYIRCASEEGFGCAEPTSAR